MCGTEQSKIIIEDHNNDLDFKMEKEDPRSPFEQYMRQKAEAQAEGDLIFEHNPQKDFIQNATSRFGVANTKTNANSRFYTTKQIDVINNDIQEDAQIINKKTHIPVISVDNLDLGRQVSRFSTVASTKGDELIKGLKTASSNQIFSYNEWSLASGQLPREGDAFIDHSFTTHESSVIGNVKQSGLPKKLENLNKKCQGLQWMKATEIDPKIQVIVDGIDPTDVVQGQLNNSYFLCALSALCEYQNRVTRLILQEEQSKNGAYGFAINQVGNWNMVIVDDNLPLIKVNDTQFKFLGANSVNAEMWVPLLEKAYAKAYGGYDLIGNGGDMRHALTDLTGAPSETFFLADFENELIVGGDAHVPYGKSNNISKNVSQKKVYDDAYSAKYIPQNFTIENKTDENGNIEPSVSIGNIQTEEGAKKLWNLIKSADINRHIICAGTRPSTQIADEYMIEFKQWSTKNPHKSMEYFSVDYFGLYPSFSYTVIGIAEYSGERLIRLRNPKGIVEWKGDWGDHSEKWSSIRQEFRAEVKDDGIFYMPFHEFANFFNELTINYYDDSYIHTAFKDTLHKDTMNVYDITVNTPGEYYFTVSQRDKRFFGSTNNNNDLYEQVGLVLTSTKGRYVEYEGGMQSKTRDNWIKVNLEFGQHTLFVKGSLKKPTIDIGISSFGVGNVQIKKHVQSSLQQTLEINLSRAFMSKIKEMGNIQWASLNKNQEHELHKVKTFRLDSSTDGYGFKMYQNNSRYSVTIEVQGQIRGGRMIFPISTQEDDLFKFAFEVKSGFTQAIFWDVDDDVVLDIKEFARIDALVK